jgi:hypothetical protein
VLLQVVGAGGEHLQREGVEPQRPRPVPRRAVQPDGAGDRIEILGDNVSGLAGVGSGEQQRDGGGVAGWSCVLREEPYQCRLIVGEWSNIHRRGAAALFMVEAGTGVVEGQPQPHRGDEQRPQRGTACPPGCDGWRGDRVVAAAVAGGHEPGQQLMVDAAERGDAAGGGETGETAQDLREPRSRRGADHRIGRPRRQHRVNAGGQTVDGRGWFPDQRQP